MKKILAASLLLAASSAQATIVDFQDVSSGNCLSQGNTVTSQGFSFTGNPSDPNLWVCNAFVNGNNSSAALIDANSLSIVTMVAADASLFDLNSFYSGSRTKDYDTQVVNPTYGQSLGIDIVGTKSGGATVSQSISFTGLDFDQFTLSSAFTDLASVTFTSIGGGRTEFLLDDIVVNNVAVPAPSILSLLGLGLLGMKLRSRKS